MDITLKTLTETQLIECKEDILRNGVIIPLLRKIGLHGVRPYHGPREFGIDVLFESVDFFDRPKYFGVSVKTERLDYTAKEEPKRNLQTICYQISKAKKAKFPSSNYTQVYLDGYYVITSKSVSREAVDFILDNQRDFSYIDIIDGQELFRIIQEMEHLRHRLTSWKHNFAPVAERIYTEK
jgi:hypothetical protein